MRGLLFRLRKRRHRQHDNRPGRICLPAQRTVVQPLKQFFGGSREFSLPDYSFWPDMDRCGHPTDSAGPNNL